MVITDGLSGIGILGHWLSIAADTPILVSSESRTYLSLIKYCLPSVPGFQGIRCNGS